MRSVASVSVRFSIPHARRPGEIDSFRTHRPDGGFSENELPASVASRRRADEAISANDGLPAVVADVGRAPVVVEAARPLRRRCCGMHAASSATRSALRRRRNRCACLQPTRRSRGRRAAHADSPTCERQPAVLSNESAPLVRSSKVRLLERQILEAGVSFEAVDRGQPNWLAKARENSAQWRNLKIQRKISVVSSKKFSRVLHYIFPAYISQGLTPPHVPMDSYGM